MLVNFANDRRIHAVGVSRSGPGRPPDLRKVYCLNPETAMAQLGRLLAKAL